MPNTKVVGIIFPYILTPIPNLYDHSFPRYGQVFNLSATYDLDLWPKILKIFVSHGVPIRNMYAKFHNDRLRNYTLRYYTLKFCENTDKQTNKQTHRQTDRHGHYNTSPSPMGGEVMSKSIYKYSLCYPPNELTTFNQTVVCHVDLSALPR